MRSKTNVAACLRDPATCGTAIALIVVDRYGFEALNWEPEVLRAELETDFDVELHPLVVDKLGAVVTLLTSNVAMVDPLAFNTVCEALAGDPVDEDVIDMVDPEQMAVSIAEMIKLLGSKPLEEMGDDVRRYMGVVLAQHGLDVAPELLAFAVMPPQASEVMQESAEFTPELAQARMSMQQEVIDDMYAAVVEHLQRIDSQVLALGFTASGTPEAARPPTSGR